MIEWLSHNRVLLYGKQDLDTRRETNVENGCVPIQWKLIRRLKHFKKNYGRVDMLENVSPSFLYYIDVDLAAEKYVIRDMSTEEILHKIPSYLMRCDKKDPGAAFKKFKWVGDEMFKVLNNTGMEKLVDIGTEFKQE